MTPLRKELQVFITACETLIGLHASKELTDEDRAVLEYYLNELPLLIHIPSKKPESMPEGIVVR